MSSFPVCSVVSDWKGTLLFVDTQYMEELKKHFRILKKNGNTVIGIEISGVLIDLKSCFDEIININDSIYTINHKLNYYSSIITDNQLSAREIEILTMVAQGLSNKQIADRLFISIHTVITHRKNITAKLGIKSIPGLTLYAALNNMVEFH